MTQVEFDEPGFESYNPSNHGEEKSVIVRLVEKIGVPPEYVNYFMIGLAILFFILTFIVVFLFFIK